MTPPAARCSLCDSPALATARATSAAGEALSCHCPRCGYYLLAPPALAVLATLTAAARRRLGGTLAAAPAATPWDAVELTPADLARAAAEAS